MGGYEGSVCTFGCNSIDYKLDNKTPYRIECKNYMWVPTGGPKGFVAGKTQAKCVLTMPLRVWRRKLPNHFIHWPQCVASIKSCQVKSTPVNRDVTEPTTMLNRLKRSSKMMARRHSIQISSKQFSIHSFLT